LLNKDYYLLRPGLTISLRAECRPTVLFIVLTYYKVTDNSLKWMRMTADKP